MECAACEAARVCLVRRAWWGVRGGAGRAWWGVSNGEEASAEWGGEGAIGVVSRRLVLWSETGGRVAGTCFEATCACAARNEARIQSAKKRRAARDCALPSACRDAYHAKEAVALLRRSADWLMIGAADWLIG